MKIVENEENMTNSMKKYYDTKIYDLNVKSNELNTVL